MRFSPLLMLVGISLCAQTAATSRAHCAAIDAQSDALFQQGESLYRRGIFRQALPSLMEAAKRGHPRAQALIGAMYWNGRGVPKDLQQSAYWYTKAAAQGHRAAQYNLAGLYEMGAGGLPKDMVKSAQLLEASARQDYPEAQFALGVDYEFGEGVARSRRTAIDWLDQAANHGSDDARMLTRWLRQPNTPQFATERELAQYIASKLYPQPAASRNQDGGQLPLYHSMREAFAPENSLPVAARWHRFNTCLANRTHPACY